MSECDSLASMNPLEHLADRLPPGLLRATSATSAGLALAGSGSLFAATVFGSALWAGLGILAFTLAGVLWHVTAVASEEPATRGRQRVTGSR